MTSRDGFPWRIASVSVLTITVGMLPGFLPGALAVQIGGDLDISAAGIGVVVGVFFAVSALVSPLMGRLAERTSWAPSMRLAAIGSSVTLGLTALLATSLLTLCAVSVIGGVAVALAHPATNLALARCTVVGRQGLVYGFKHAAVPAAIGLGGLAVPTVALPLGWEWVFSIGAALALVAAILVPFHPFDYEVKPTTMAVPGESGQPSTALWLLVVLAIGAGFGIMALDGFATFLVLYSVDIGFSEAAAGALLAFGSLLGISMRLFAGWQMDRRATGGLPTVSVFMLLGAIGMGLIASGVSALVVFGTFAGFAFGWGWSGLFTYSVVRANPLAPAASTGITMTGIFVGAAVGPPLFGFLADGISFTVAWVTMAVALLAASALMRFGAGRIPE